MTLRLRFRGDRMTGQMVLLVRWRRALVVMTALVSALSSVSAQAPRGVIAARVVDVADQPVADAELFIAQLEQRLRTDANGAARLVGVPPGTYDITARRVGFLPRTVKVIAADSSAMTVYTVITLIAHTTRLAPVLTSASRGGLSGVVSDTALRPLANARIRIAGSGRTTRTDSAGAFYMALRGGSYMLYVERDSFVAQTIGVFVPKDSGREVAVWLSPELRRNRAAAVVEAARQFDLDQRMIRASPTRSRFYTRDQLLALNIIDMSRLARQWASGAITALCEVGVMGGAHERGYSVPLNSVETDEVEFVEVYFGGMPSNSMSSGGVPARGAANLRAGRSRSTSSAGLLPRGSTPCGNVQMTVWLRQ